MSEIIEQPKALAVIPRTAIATIIAADQDDILGKLAAKIAAFRPDVTTEQGRKEIASLAYEVATSKMDLIRLGKRLTEDWRKQTNAVNAECRIIEERMDALKAQVSAPLDAFKAREKTRVEGHQNALADISNYGLLPSEATAAEIQRAIAALEALPSRDWQEFSDIAASTRVQTLAKLQALHGAAVRREEEAAELARLRAEQAERVRQERARAEAERVKEIAAKAAEDARLAAERKAAEEARLAQERADQERRAVEAQRLAAEQARAEAEARARRAEQAQRDAEARAEADRLEAERRAEERRQAAIEEERRRVAEAKRQEEAAAAKRAANLAHKRKINGEALADITAAMKAEGFGDLPDFEAVAKAIVVFIASGRVRHTSITY